MSTRTGSHQLSNGLVVSGRPEQQLKERQPTMASRAVPYTGGDVKRSGELGRMYGVDLSSGDHHHHPPSVAHRSSPRGRLNLSAQQRICQIRSEFRPNGPENHELGANEQKIVLLVILRPDDADSTHRTNHLGSAGTDQLEPSGQLDAPSAPSSFNKAIYGSAVTSLGEAVKLGFRVSRVAMWVFLVVVVMGLVVGAFLLAAVKKPVILVAVVAVLVPAVVIFIWNFAYKKKGVLGFLKKYPDAELRGAVDGQFVKVTGKYVADFYISDFQSGLKTLVKAGYGAKVAPFVKPTVVVDVTKDNKNLSPTFLRWLSDRGLSSEDRAMRLKEGYIKEGSTVSIMGVVRRHDNVLMIVPPTEPVSTGCR
ncbi:LOW QUALITY PROTEIN: hypothetical protein DH2020_017225 [Rehmannia glutinosa]|uniref:Uncharacterized protein n=1 Tax=Rehmannia glutinosa TaxID=99300 RepID=A0ABR0WUI4_REHGL